MPSQLSRPLTLKVMEEAILSKAHQRNEELHKEFYSYDAKEYEFIDVTNFKTYELLLFRCPKSKSTVSIKIEGDKHVSDN